MILHLWERRTAAVGSTRRTWKTTTRNGWKSRPRAWLTKQRLHFNKERYLQLHSLLLLLQGPWSRLPQVSRVLLALAWCLHPTWEALPWCRWWVLLLLGWCPWDLLLEWGLPWVATCPWCPGLQWWDHLLALWWCPHGLAWLGQTDKSGKALFRFCISCSVSAVDHGAEPGCFLAVRQARLPLSWQNSLEEEKWG